MGFARFSVGLLVLLTGCQMAVPMHTWSAAKVAKPGVVRVAVAPVGVASRAMPTHQSNGMDELQQVAKQLEQALQTAPRLPTPLLVAIYPSDLERVSSIQLVSYDQQPNDVATVGAARNAQADLLLQGNVVFANLNPQAPNRRSFLGKMFAKKPVGFLTVHWTVTDIASGQRVLESTIETTDKDVKRAMKKAGPSLHYHDSSVLALASYRGWQLVSSEPRPSEIMVDLPWFWLGAAQVRKGNAYAKQGRWDLAEREWQSVADSHPTNAAAWHNLALAAVANEDFDLARSRLKHADSITRLRSTFDTELWLEKQQRSFHSIMNLPPPAEGWKFPDSTIDSIKE